LTKKKGVGDKVYKNGRGPGEEGVKEAKSNSTLEAGAKKKTKDWGENKKGRRQRYKDWDG